MGNMVQAGAGGGAGIFDMPEPEPHNGPAPQHWTIPSLYLCVGGGVPAPGEI
jgi:hypothetical protein